MTSVDIQHYAFLTEVGGKLRFHRAGIAEADLNELRFCNANGSWADDASPIGSSIPKD